MGLNASLGRAGRGDEKSSIFKRPICLGVVIGSRAFFSPAPCKVARDEVLAQLERLGIGAVILPFGATEN